MTAERRPTDPEWCEWCNGWRRPTHFDADDQCIPSTIRDRIVEEARKSDDAGIRAMLAELDRVERETLLEKRS